jgi:hypothetical protein
MSKDSLFVSIINRSPTDSFSLVINQPFKIKSHLKKYLLYSPNYQDANTSDNPFNIAPSMSIIDTAQIYYVPKHSVTIFAFALVNSDIDSTNILNFDALIYPNPFSANLSLIFNMKQEQNVKIEIVDIFGRNIYDEVKLLDSNTVHQITLPVSSGCYFVRLSSNGKSIVKRIIKIN